MKNTSPYLLDFRDIDKSMLALVGGKGANLGELSRIEGIQVPGGFCITTEAFKKIIDESPLMKEFFDRLSLLGLEDRNQVSELSTEIRKFIEGVTIPVEIEEVIIRHLSMFDEHDGHEGKNTFAVRSSATAEDLPSASFAGQQDTYLNVIGKQAILKHVSKCWASLFTDRAVIYRLQNGFDHRNVQLSVVVQKMVFPQVAGIVFTADPLTSNRKVLSIDASFGLGEALVSGLVNADNYKVSKGRIIDKKISSKKLAIYALNQGGTKQQEIEPDQQNTQALTDEQILQLERMGRRIEEHFGSPQDIEWCLVDECFYIVQSRPITTLFPIPALPEKWDPETTDLENHVYVSVGHQQMMTDAMKPLGLSFFMLTTRAPMRTAGGRLFIEITNQLASPAGRKVLMDGLGKSDPLIKDALLTIMERTDFIKSSPDENMSASPGKADEAPIENDPAIAAGIITRYEASIAALKQNILAKSGSELFDFILEDIRQMQNILFVPENMAVIVTAIHASFWINEKMFEWLGEKNAADTLSQSVPNNITSEMGLELLDVADVIRPYPEVIEYLRNINEEEFPGRMVQLKGGRESLDSILAFLDKYGVRCAGEIDITKTRWSEKPTTLLPVILSNIKNFEPKAGKRKFEHGRQEALKKEQELLDRLKQLPDGEQKAEEAKYKIDMIRNFAGYREYPKYGIVSRYFIYKQALLKEAKQLAEAGVIHEKEDIYYLGFEELHEVVRTKKLDYQVISQRKDEFKLFEKLTPPRMITSDGEVITGRYNRKGLPAGAIPGLAVSSGVIEGRARVILTMEDADLEEGDILVTVFTDPSWTPLFLSIKGLVTEVGGVMTHGAVIAREYGLPAVVGVENATKLIKDGERIRVNGIEGYVEIL